jgi:NTP pyrophosphatase (non-canonical NTP hydrolase)
MKIDTGSATKVVPPCHAKPRAEWCDHSGGGGFMGHTCYPRPVVPLTFDALRAANTARLPLFKNKHGQTAHAKADGSDWSPAQWLQAVVGELGEYANLRKKYERGDLGEVEFQREAADELSDVQMYLDILAMQLGVDLGAATVSKFNRVSIRVGCGVRL